jgi:hypothetical protein
MFFLKNIGIRAATARKRRISAQQQRGGGGEKRFPHFLGSL